MRSYQRTGKRSVTQPIIWLLGLGCFTAPLLGQVDLRWRDVTDELGIVSPARLPPSGRYLLTEAFTGRAVPFDFDRDGDLDLLLTYGPHVADSLYSGLNRLYRQDDTAWVDVTAQTGLTRLPPAANAAVGDVDGDGFPDLYLTLFGSDRLLRNENGRWWRDVTDSAGIANDYWATDALFFDANGDGYLDLYVANYLDYPGEDTALCRDPATRQQTACDPLLYEPAPNRLFLNDSTGRFRDMTAALGLADTTSRSLAVKLLDADADGYLDLFVLSYRSPNLLYLGSADSGFGEAGLLAGVALAPDGREQEWSQALTLDANQDGYTDLLLTRRDRQILMLLNDGRGLFFEGQYQTGLFQPRFPYLAANVAAADLDFSGTVDLIFADPGHEPPVDAPAADSLQVDSLDAAPDSSFGPVPEKPAPHYQPRRILLSDREHRFHPVEMKVPMLLDTTLLAAHVLAGPGRDFLSGEAPGVAVFPRVPDGQPYGSVTTGRFEEAAMDTAAVSSPELPGYVELDTLKVRQEALRYVVADLTGDGVAEIIATYPVGLFRIWRRELLREPRYVGLWPQADRPGATAIGTELLVTGNPAGGASRRFVVTDPNPVILYFSRRVRSVDVVVKWPGGPESRYRALPLNSTYTLTRMDPEP